MKIPVDSRMAWWFVWCCDHLPMTVTRDYSVDKTNGVRRWGAHYVENGTTLCHLFWAMLWMPLMLAALAGLLVFLFGAMHVGAYRDLGIGVAGFFLPEAVMLGFALAAALVIFAVIGGNSSGFFRFLAQYLKGLKDRVCPLVKFDQ